MSVYRLSVAEYNARELKKKMGRVKNVKKKVIDGITFDSTKEARRYQDLVLMQKAGQIRDLRRQVPFPIVIHHTKCFDWFADFCYEERGEGSGWRPVVEDVKGMKSEVYRLKKRCVEAEYGFTIRET